MELSIDDYRLCEHIAQDLRHLRDAWSGELSEHVIRRESPIIRRLLVDGDYSRAWRQVGLPRQPMVLAHDLEEMLGTFPRRFVRYAFPAPSEWTRPVGGEKQAVVMANPGVEEGDLMLASPGYAEGQGVFFAVVPQAELEGADSDATARELTASIVGSLSRSWWLSEYLEGVGAYVNGIKITRREVIDFIANAMGGAHFDPEGQGRQKAARALLRPLHVKWRGTTEVHAPWIEVMSIGQAVSRSTDASRFCAEVDRLERPEGMPFSDSS